MKYEVRNSKNELFEEDFETIEEAQEFINEYSDEINDLKIVEVFEEEEESEDVPEWALPERDSINGNNWR